MIYALYFSVVAVFLTYMFYPKFKIKDKTFSTPLALGIVLGIMLLVLDLTLDNLFINPVAFSIGGLKIYWYALWIMLGVIVAVCYGVREGKKLGIYSDYIYTGIIIILPLSIIGARLWYVLFNLDQFNSFGDVIGLNGGWSGLGIQGAVITAIVSVIIYAKVTKVSIWKTFDILAPGFLIGQIFGRWGNFCNHELYGPMINNVEMFEMFLPRFISDNMYISGNYLLSGLKAGYYQPMFLYESVLNLVGLCLILIARKKVKQVESGDLIGFYLIWYGVVRTITESFRFEGEVLMLGGIRVSILMSIVFILSGIAYLVIKHLFFKQTRYVDIVEYIKNHKIDTVLFDLDGTLINSKRLIDQSFIHVFETFFPKHELTDEELDSFFGPTLNQTFAKYTNDEKQIEEMIKCYRKFNLEYHDQMVLPFDGVSETLKFLKKHNYKLGIVSSKKHDVLLKGTDLCKITDYFDFIIGGDEVTNPKPDPEGINKAIEKLDSKNVLYVGDSVGDIEAGKNANIETCAICYKEYDNRYEDLVEAEPTYIINKMYSLVKILGE